MQLTTGIIWHRHGSFENYFCKYKVIFVFQTGQFSRAVEYTYNTNKILSQNNRKEMGEDRKH